MTWIIQATFGEEVRFLRSPDEFYDMVSEFEESYIFFDSDELTEAMRGLKLYWDGKFLECKVQPVKVELEGYEDVGEEIEEDDD